MHIIHQRWVAYIALGLLAGILFLPNVVWLWFAWQAGNAPIIEIVLAASLMFLWFVVWGRWLWLGCLLLSPLALLAPMELYYIATYHMPSSVPVLQVVFATTPAEAHQFFGARVIPLIIASLICFCVALLAAGLTWHHRIKWRIQTCWLMGGFIGVIILCLPITYSS